MKTTTKLNQDAEPSTIAPVRVQPVVGTPRPITPERWQQICRGRVTVRELSTYHPKLKSFRTKYAAQVAGVLLKTKRGLKFKTRQAAEAAGRECLKGMRLKQCPNGPDERPATPPKGMNSKPVSQTERTPGSLDQDGSARSWKFHCCSCHYWLPEWSGPRTGYCTLLEKPKRVTSGCQKFKPMQ